MAGKPAKELTTHNWTTHHWLHFLRQLPNPIKTEQMADLDTAFHFTSSGNSEILTLWLQRVIANQYKPAYAAIEQFLTGMGRRKFLKPLYEELAKSPEGRNKARPVYHVIAVNSIDEILKGQNN